MPLTNEQLQTRVASGKPFIVGTYLGSTTDTIKAKSKANPLIKVDRVVRKHTVHNKNGIHVFSEWHNEGVVEAAVPPPALTAGQEVVVTLFKFSRDGVGYDIMGDVEPVKAGK